MNRKSLILFLLTMVSWHTAGALPATNPLHVTTITLHNGLTVWINEDHSQAKVYGAVVVKAGSNQCPGTGIAHYFEHLMFKGTRNIGTTDYANEKPWLDSIAARYDQLAATRDEKERHRLQMDINRLSLKAADYAIPNEFSNLISRYGGSKLNAYTSYDETVYHNVFSPQYLNQWLELNSERLIDPVFRLFQSELETVYEEKNRTSDNLLAAPALAVAARVFEGTPYAQPILGTTENLKNPRLSEMRKFFEDYYVAGNMGLILCGDICTDSVVSHLEATFGRIRPGKAPATLPTKARAFDGKETMKVKLPIPLVKAVGYVFHAPVDTDSDYMSLHLALRLLCNSSRSGMLDSLTNGGKVMAAVAMGYSFKEQGLTVMAAIPKVPFGSKKKAERMLWQQVERLQKGQFSDAALDAVRIETASDNKRKLESIDNRAGFLISAFSHGFTWDDYLRRLATAETISKADIVRAANTWLQKQKGLRLVKSFGSYPKERVSQPGYKPIVAKNAKAESDYARRLAQLPVYAEQPRYIDYDRDAQWRQLAPLTTLYRVANPMNDLFTLSMRFYRDAEKDKRQWSAGEYVDELGTDSLSRQQLVKAFARLGAQAIVTSDRHRVTVTLSGIDDRMEPAVQLLAHYLHRVKSDKTKMRDMVNDLKIEEKAFFENNSDIFEAAMGKVMYGNASENIDRLTSGELKQMGSDALLAAFHEALHTQCDIIYTGTRSLDDVANTLTRNFDFAKIAHSYSTPVITPLQECSENVVYVFDNPKARQTLVGYYSILPAENTIKGRQTAALWADYFGGGMTSVLFQNVREYRSLAYSTGAKVVMKSLKLYPDSPLGCMAVIGTQADKAMSALSCLDSLVNNMPENAKNFETVKQQLLNESYQGYPGFRGIGNVVAEGRLKGYDRNPDPDFDAALQSLTEDDMLAFYQHNIRNGRRAYVIVGDKKSLDLSRLARYGKVKELKKEEIYKVKSE